MSEYQYIAFRAIDGPVSEKNLAYMRRQSSRAKITPWSFENEYHFGDFGGDALEMLRRGYDLHLHYANFGIRNLLIRLPHGLANPDTAKPYLLEDSLHFAQDKQGSGGTLCIEPYYEPGDQEELWELDDLLDGVVPLRAEILDGDLRPLYLAHLAIARDGNHDREETREGPVPAGLKKLTNAQRVLAKFFGLGDALLAAAAEGSLPPSTKIDPGSHYADWLQSQPQATKDAWLAGLMADPHANVRTEILAEFRKGRAAAIWPSMRRDRTISELEAMAEKIQEETTRKQADKVARQRAKRLAAMAADPGRTVRETEELVTQRSLEAYRQIATQLADLRAALAGSDQSGLAQQQAQKLKSNNPTLKMLTSALRQKGLLPK
jgi:hypothetical protein